MQIFFRPCRNSLLCHTEQGGSDLADAASSQAALLTHQESPCKAQIASENTTGIVLKKPSRRTESLVGWLGNDALSKPGQSESEIYALAFG